MKPRPWLFGFLALCLLIPFHAAHAQLAECAAPVGPKLPDLIVDREKLANQWHIEETAFAANSCTVVEGCVTGSGERRLLRFTSSTPNIGDADLVIGNPQNCLGSLFRFSECHQHLHFQEYADYRLWTPAGYQTWVAERDPNQPTTGPKNAKLLDRLRRSGALVVGRKQGFCVIDVAPYPEFGKNPPPPKYVSCASNQGLSVGYTDEYHFTLGCQFVDITDVAPGEYVLEDEVNPERLFPEKDYTNNSAAITITIAPRTGRTPRTAAKLDAPTTAPRAASCTECSKARVRGNR